MSSKSLTVTPAQQITPANQKPPLKERFIEYARTRKGLSVVSWSFGLGIIVLLSASVAPINTTAEMGVMVASTFIISICTLISIFARYVDSEKFPASAFFNIGLTFFFSFSSIGILSIDLAFTLNHKYYNDLVEQKKHETLLAILWNMIYWGSLLCGTVFSKFFSKYWTSGHFSVCGRVKHSLKQLLILMVSGGVVFAIIGGSYYSYFGFTGVSGIKAAAQIMLNVVSMLQLVLLLAYGLFNLPVFLWKCADNKHSLYEQLQNAQLVREEYRAAMSDFQMYVIECKNLISQYRNGYNTAFMDILEEELPQQDLEGQSIGQSSTFMMELKKGQDITEDFLANVRYQLKVSFFLYKRKKAKWVNLFYKVDSLVQKPLDFERIRERVNLDKNQKIKDEDDQLTLDDLILKPIPNNARKISITRISAIICIMFAFLVISTEGLMVYNPKYTLMYFIVQRHPYFTALNFIFTLVFLSSITLVCFFTIFNLRLSDYLQLVPHHTDCITFSSITGYCCKIITVGCFNYMMIIGEMAVGKDKDPFGTGYCDFYSSMIKVHFFQEYFNKLMCLLIMIFGSLFGLLSLFKYQNKAIAAFSRYGKIVQKTIKQKEDQIMKKKQKEATQMEVDNEKNKKEEKEINLNSVGQSELKIIQQILRGERSILAEYDAIKRKEERTKLFRIDDIEMMAGVAIQNSGKNDKVELDKNGKVISKKNNSSDNVTKQLLKQNTKHLHVDDKKQPLLTKKKTRKGGVLNSSDSFVSEDLSDLSQQNLNKNSALQNRNNNQQFPFAQTEKRAQFGVFKKAKIELEDDKKQNRGDGNKQNGNKGGKRKKGIFEVSSDESNEIENKNSDDEDADKKKKGQDQNANRAENKNSKATPTQNNAASQLKNQQKSKSNMKVTATEQNDREDKKTNQKLSKKKVTYDSSEEENKKNNNKNKKNNQKSSEESSDDSDDDEEVKGKTLLKKTNNVIAARFGAAGGGGGDFKSRLFQKRNQAKNQQEEAKQKRSKQKSKQKDKNIAKEGWLLKRKGGKLKIRKAWLRRYAVIEGQYLKFYEDEEMDQFIKQIDLSKIKSVNFHYDESAPVQSKKINKKDKEESRFDLYHKDNKSKKYKFKLDDDNVWEGQAWVDALKEAVKESNDDYKSS